MAWPLLNWFYGRNSKAPQVQEQTRVATPTEVLLQEIETAELMLETSGTFKAVAQIGRTLRNDPYVRSLLDVRTSGLISLPALYDATKGVKRNMMAKDGSGRDPFTRIWPGTDQANHVASELIHGVGLSEIVRLTDGSVTVVNRALDPLQRTQGTWLYNGEEVIPGKGRWILTVRGQERPWLYGLFPALSRVAVERRLGSLNRLAFIRTLANTVVLITAPNGATEDDMQEVVASYTNLATNNVRAVKAGWQAQFLEVTSGVGSAAFDKVVSDSSESIALLLCGQTVTVDGSKGAFLNLSYFAAIRRDLAMNDLASFDRGVNEQFMPHVFPGVSRRLDLTDDGDKVKKAQMLQQYATAIKMLREAEINIDEAELVRQFNLPVLGTGQTEAAQDSQEIDAAELFDEAAE